MSIAYSFPKKQERSSLSDERNNSPGPNAYDPERSMRIVKEQSPEWTISRSQRPDFNQEVPGPGQYEADINKLKMNVSYTMGSKTDYQSPSKSVSFQMPGPGSYDQHIMHKQPVYTMGVKREEIRNLNTPGPGTYDLQNNNQLLRNSQRGVASPFSSKSKRDSQILHKQAMSEVLSSPGPGAYNPNAEYVKYQNPTYGINKGQKGITSKDLNPGPGSYEAASKEIGKSMNNLTFKGRPQTSRMIDIPGPGSYNNQHKTIDQTVKSQRGVSTIRNKSDRLLSPTKDQIKNPGPGAYDGNYTAVKDQGRAFGFGKSERKSQITQEDNYKPGPGNYEVKDTKTSKSFKISQKSNYQNKNTTPGPGNYEPNSDFVKSSSKSVKIHKGLNQSALYSSKSQIFNPGPGTYTQKKEFGSEAKSFQIRGKPRDISKNMSPGPGTYDPSDALSKDKKYSATIMSGSKRNQDYYTINSSNPGPGQYYDMSKEFGKNAKSFTMQGKPQNTKDNKVPGPGQYNANEKIIRPTTPGYKQSSSTRKEFITKEDMQKPGPGNYSNNNKTIGKDVPSFTMGQKREQKQEVSPGPGQYDGNQNFTKDIFNSDSIRNVKIGGTTQRPDIVPKNARDQPGPGNYHNVQNFGQNQPAFSFSSKKSHKQGTKTPGPGAYDASPNNIKDKVPSYKMGSSKRSQLVNREAIQTPGPGIYEKGPSIGQGGPKYSFQTKNEPKINNLVPGPGEYDPNSNALKDKVRSFQMGTSQRQQIIPRENQYIPGPGNYESPTKTSGPQVIFHFLFSQYTMRGRSKSRQDLSPGPGEYEPQNYLTKDKTPAYGMNKSMRQEIISKEQIQLPGPGTYQNLNEFGKDVKSFQIRGKPEDKVKSDVPGPGQYQADSSFVKDRVVSHKMNLSLRPDIVTKEMLYQPGPGEYDSPRSFGHDAQSVTIRGRPKDNQRHNSPGPGHYSPDPTIVKDKAVSYRMSNSKRTELISKELQQLPGPGIYDQPSTIGKNQSYTIGQKHQEQKDNMVPGPGNYNPSDYLTKDQAKTTFKISQTSRQPFVHREMIEKPGPGQYESPSRYTGPQFSIGGRTESPVIYTPGPGEYNPDPSAVRHQNPSIRFDDKTQRTNMISKEEQQKPGPGNYEVLKSFGEDAKTFQIRGKPQDKVGNEMPGPGEYEPSQNQIKDRVQAFKIGSSQRQTMVNKEATNLPGPGQYESPSKKSGPQFTIGQRTESPVTYTPGPGEYNPDPSTVRHKNPSIRFDDKTLRTNLIDKEELQKPGPGNYQVIKSFGEDAKTFQIRGKPQEKVGNEIPGPGEYEPSQNQIKDRVQAFKIGSSQRQTMVSKEATNLPGPGQYDSPSKQSGPQFTIGQRTESPIRYAPGPGEYNPDPSAVRHQNPSIRFDDKTQRTNLINKEELQKPGPGNYNYLQNFGDDAKTFQIRGRPQDKVGNEVPGPGEYQADPNAIRHHSPSFKIDPKTQRTDIINKEDLQKLGPGSYAHTTNFGDNAKTFLIRGKPQEKIDNTVPGPGSYDANESLVKYQSPSYKMNDKTQRTSLVFQDQVYLPGPGNYDQPSTIGQGPSFQLRGKPSPERDNKVPGPGSYEANHNALKDSTSQSFRISSNKRELDLVQQDIAQQPGPGSYNIQSKYEGPVYTIRGRDQINDNNGVPGPGTYQENPNIMKHNNPSIDFSRSPDRSRTNSPYKDNLPGPGQYQDDINYYVGNSSAISYTIPKGEYKQLVNDSPGPGYYKLPAKIADVPRYNKTAQNEEFRWV